MFIINKIVQRRRLMDSMEREEERTTGKGQEKQTTANGYAEQCGLELTNLHKRALRCTWRRIIGESKTSPLALKIMKDVFDRVCHKDQRAFDLLHKWPPQAMLVQAPVPLNTKATVKIHTTMLVQLLDSIISNLDKEGWDDPMNTGAVHNHLKEHNFPGDLWETFGQALSEVMFKQEVVQAYPNAKQAWMILIANATDRMRHGFDKPPRKAEEKPPAPKRVPSKSKLADTESQSSVQGGQPDKERQKSQGRRSASVSRTPSSGSGESSSGKYGGLRSRLSAEYLPGYSIATAAVPLGSSLRNSMEIGYDKRIEESSRRRSERKSDERKMPASPRLRSLHHKYSSDYLSDLTRVPFGVSDSPQPSHSREWDYLDDRRTQQRDRRSAGSGYAYQQQPPDSFYYNQQVARMMGDAAQGYARYGYGRYPVKSVTKHLSLHDLHDE